METNSKTIYYNVVRREDCTLQVTDWARPYELFCVLAGAARYKVSTVDANTEIQKIAEPRGFPEDMNSFYQNYFDENQEKPDFTFCHSWLMVQEIIDFDWDNQFIVQTATYKLENSSERDNIWVFKNTPKEQILEVKDVKDESPEIIKTTITWKETYREFVGRTEWFMKDLLKLGSPDKVRIIFWFNC